MLKGPQNTQILTVMRDSGSFSGQRQQMAFTREKGVKRGAEGRVEEGEGGKQMGPSLRKHCSSSVRCCVSIVASID